MSQTKINWKFIALRELFQNSKRHDNNVLHNFSTKTSSEISVFHSEEFVLIEKQLINTKSIEVLEKFFFQDRECAFLPLQNNILVISWWKAIHTKENLSWTLLRITHHVIWSNLAMHWLELCLVCIVTHQKELVNQGKPRKVIASNIFCRYCFLGRSLVWSTEYS